MASMSIRSCSQSGAFLLLAPSCRRFREVDCGVPVADLGAKLSFIVPGAEACSGSKRDSADHLPTVGIILELGGPETYQRSLRALAAGGRIIQVGVLTGFGPKPDLGPLQSLNADILGVTVGSVEHFRSLNAFMAERRIVPVLDRVVAFEEAPAAYAHLRSGRHFGKVVIRLPT